MAKHMVLMYLQFRILEISHWGMAINPWIPRGPHDPHGTHMGPTWAQVISSGHGEWKLIDICSAEVGFSSVLQLPSGELT